MRTGREYSRSNNQYLTVSGKGVRSMNLRTVRAQTNVMIPPIDAVVPKKVAVATFAMG
jgi:hypothetical protein